MTQFIKKKQSPKLLPSVVQEHELTLPYLRGEYALEIGEEPNSAKRKVTRLRRKCVYDEMMNRGSISEEQRNCAERYAILCEKALGSTGDLYARINLLKEGRGNWEPSSSQHEAYDKLFRIWKSMGRYHREIIDMIVLGNIGTKEISKLVKLNLHYTMGQVLSAFILLEEALKENYSL
ncbi:hypothetical protein [Commensalibacter oyaizuii]|uniref:Uncharacterized protein n=1 Tax=Commensalibacter oyaizuii TaxID=3043873 RepID=A0ABT6Q3H5_9PROT|nr:hypothetical protein [Commensalibacter sp. TBRC 16381]MDI2091665.1 hypothetical protein [Commensalibacter sp. TBRC 16381]